ncbi:MAG: GxxExxY protein [Planctomycetota bacterium]|nr:GxxExxY protein [Planctomycetota bacterium]
MENPASRLRRKDLLYPKENYEIKGVCIKVHNALGCGFLEKVYENSLAHELRKHGFVVQKQASLQVFYDRLLVGDFVVDLLVDDKFVIEIKATERDQPLYKAQLINYLKAAGLPLGFLVNFGKESLQFERVVYTKRDALNPQ